MDIGLLFSLDSLNDVNVLDMPQIVTEILQGIFFLAFRDVVNCTEQDSFSRLPDGAVWRYWAVVASTALDSPSMKKKMFSSRHDAMQKDIRRFGLLVSFLALLKNPWSSCNCSACNVMKGAMNLPTHGCVDAPRCLPERGTVNDGKCN